MRGSVIPLTDTAALDPGVTGNKGATLAKMITEELPVPPGFVVSTGVFADTLGDRTSRIDDALSDLRSPEQDSLQRMSDVVRRIILDAELSDSAINAIRVEYEKLGHGAVSVRSSATAEDLPDASFAGQYDSF